tara:strand:- start:1106 stop:1330 length:225 start_codon:yes stop_codon:yes gene_type:complete
MPRDDEKMSLLPVFAAALIFSFVAYFPLAQIYINFRERRNERPSLDRVISPSTTFVTQDTKIYSPRRDSGPYEE